MQFKPSVPLNGQNYNEFKKFALDYGTKAAGLVILPRLWTPEFAVLSTDLHKQWRQGQLTNTNLAIDRLGNWIDGLGCESVIIRSSGVNEKIDDRGKYKSIKIETRNRKKDLLDSIHQIFSEASKTDENEVLGLVVQKYLDPSFIGHLSNELNLSPSRNQWKYEVEKPWVPIKGLNSKFAPLPDPNGTVNCGKTIPHQALRSVGRWLNDHVGPRCHIEWLTHEEDLWLVQLDLEWRELDSGIDPTTKQLFPHFNPPKFNSAKKLIHYAIGEETEWKKLKNLSEFDFDSDNHGPNLYLLQASTVLACKRHASARSALVKEIEELTGNRVVVRTDCKQEGGRTFNLPRTDTVSAKKAFEWCCTTISKLRKDGLETENIAFLVHAFIPAKSSAWAYASPDNPTVLVDALWGLPDGLQVLPVDTYEVNVLQQKVIDTRSTYKPRFLREQKSGRWVYENVLRSKGRTHVLKKPDIIEIASRTYQIAQKLKDEAQIMWFCEIPEEFGVGKNLPWYRSREKLDTAPREGIRYKPFSVRNPKDLKALPDRQAMIRLSPDANLIRDDDFLQKVIDSALEKRLPVLLEGSALGHINYRLCQAGVNVVLENAPKYYRKRHRRAFGKIVRDEIPVKIVSGGESVIEAVLDKSDVRHGLAGKVIEELEEFLLAQGVEEKKAELADVLEVLIGLANSEEIPWDEIVRTADEKRLKRGGFFQRRVLLETSLPQRKAPLDTRKTVDIRDLGLLETTKQEMRIPVTSLVNSVGRSELLVKLPESEFSFRMRIRDGRLIITMSESHNINVEDQLSLFDEDT